MVVVGILGSGIRLCDGKEDVVVNVGYESSKRTSATLSKSTFRHISESSVLWT